MFNKSAEWSRRCFHLTSAPFQQAYHYGTFLKPEGQEESQLEGEPALNMLVKRRPSVPHGDVILESLPQ